MDNESTLLNQEYSDPRTLLRKHGLQPKRAFSQNFLIHPKAVEQIAEVAQSLGTMIVELGPGLGTLTTPLLRRGCQVIAVELDLDMIAVLREELKRFPMLRIIQGDAGALDLTRLSSEMGSKLVLAGNLPYQVTGAIMRQVTKHWRALLGAVLMVQREVGARIVAKPGSKDYGALTVWIRACFDPQVVFKLKPSAFYPSPRVDSMVVKLVPLENPESATQTWAFDEVVRAAFQTRRKTLRNALRSAASTQFVEQVLQEAQLDGKRRGETLSVQEFALLASHWMNRA